VRGSACVGRENEDTKRNQPIWGQTAGKKGALVLAFIMTISRVVMQKKDHWKDQISFYRFWNNEKVTEEALKRSLEDRCVEQTRGMSEVVIIEDTSEMNLEKHRNRIKDKSGLGTVGNGTDLGFFCHPTLVVDPRDKTIIGVVDLHLWAREETAGEAKREGKKGNRHTETIPFEEKESYRWAERAILARRKLSHVPQVTAVQDREGDIFESYACLRENEVNWVVRANHDRTVEAEKGENLKVREYLGGLEAADGYEMELARKGKKKEVIEMELRYGRVRIKRPGERRKRYREKYPEYIEVTVVQAAQREDTVRAGENRVEWNLYTNRSVTSAEQAREIVEIYKSRWLIEELFRTVKSEGLKYEESELESGKALRKLCVMAVMAAIQIVQLKQAREGNGNQKVSLVFDEEQIECLEDALPKFEGKTEKQMNPYPKEHLAWAAWLIARMGGWKVYANRPPGVITLHDGWVRFQNIFAGWLIAKDVYKR
jgi:hypothetical protein